MVSTMKVSASEHPIKSVTVFKSSKAEIVRTFALELQAGQNKVEIRGLPSTIDTHSVRVSGLGDARLFDVVCTIGDDQTSYDEDSPSETIRLLKDKKDMLESEKRVREHEADMLVNYSKTLSGEHVTPVDMARFLESFVEQGRKNLTAVNALGQQIVNVDRQIESITKKMAAKKGSANGEVTVVVGTEEGTNVELKLTYIVSNATWEPKYELHATTENGKPSASVSLHYRARITQSTGEDWTDSTLTLSTVASDTMAKSIPQLMPLKIKPQGFVKSAQPNNKGTSLFNNNTGFKNVNAQAASIFGSSAFGLSTNAQPQVGGIFGGGGGLFGQQQQQQPQQQPQPQTTVAFGAFGGGGPPPLSVAHEDDGEDDPSTFEEVAVPGAFSEPTTIVTETPLAISYSVEGKSSIPSDGIAHQASVAELPFEAKISHVAIPRIEPRVYLQCEVKNASEYRLLPGPVSVILDDSYVSKTWINDINTGDTFDCTLGADSSAKVTYSRTSRSKKSAGGTFAEISNIVTYNTKITIQNKHQFAISDLVVRDVLPLCDDKRAKVILRKPEGLADAKDGQAVNLEDGLKVMWEKLVDGKGGEKEGKYEWRWKVDSGAKVTLEAEWEIKAPADIQWAETYERSLFGERPIPR